jgi:molecular chaperone HscB
MTPVSTTLEACPSCGAIPRSPLLCESCGRLLEPRATPDPFEAFGLEPAFALDASALQKRLLTLSRALHPDFHGNAGPGLRRRAEENTALLNAAYAVLADDFRRADWLVRVLGGPREDEERSMPAKFLQEVLEWNEAIEEARAAAPGSPARRALVPLTERLRQERAHGMDAVARFLDPLPAPRDAVLRRVRQQLNALRYLDRALAGLGELALDSAP